jgi:hypothetical protein
VPITSTGILRLSTTWTVFHEMNHREPPHLSAAKRRAGLWLTLSLLPAVAPTGVHAMPRSLTIAIVSRTAESTPYLSATGAPPLRFREMAVPVDPTPRPTDVAINPPPSASAASTSESSAAPTPVAVASATQVSEAASANAQPNGRETSAPTKAPAQILPDDSRPAVRPEDFIPYFQIPGSARHPADVTLLVPVPKAPPSPGALPPSSATYTQSPK